MDAHSHVDIFIGSSIKLLDGINHGKAHRNAALGMIWSGFRASTYTVVTVTQCADLLTPTPLADDVKTTKQVVEQSNKLICCLIRVNAHQGK